MRGFINGVVFTLAVLLAAFIAGVWFGVLPSGADAKQLPFEDWAAHRALHASIARDTAAEAGTTLQPTDANLLAGVKLYGANCAVCHGAADAKRSNLAQGFYIASPQLAKDGVEDDPENVTHWKLVHGIRFTAMPAFATTLADDDLWKITLFLKHMDNLPPPVDAAWKQLPSVASPASAATPETSASPEAGASAEASAAPGASASPDDGGSPSAEPSASP
jgi:mono/diheme cytochrome c family protein